MGEILEKLLAIFAPAKYAFQEGCPLNMLLISPYNQIASWPG
jgi:hypothetical protein